MRTHAIQAAKQRIEPREGPRRAVALPASSVAPLGAHGGEQCGQVVEVWCRVPGSTRGPKIARSGDGRDARRFDICVGPIKVRHMVTSPSIPSGARPTLWRTCRVLANTTRLRILRALIEEPGQSVSAIARTMRLDLPLATHHLRSLGARGLLEAERKGAWVYYRPSPDPMIPEARSLLDSLSETFENDKGASRSIYRLATAFTHPRRQSIYGALQEGDQSFTELRTQTGIPVRALCRHLRKLRERGFVVLGEGQYRATIPPGSFARVLASLAPTARR